MTALPRTLADILRTWKLERRHTTCDFCRRDLLAVQVRTTLYAGRMCYLCSACLKGMRR